MLTRYDPFDDMFRLSRALFSTGANGTERKASFSPAVEIEDTKDAMFVRAELPGMKEDDIHVEVDKNLLTLKGERTYEEKQEAEGWVRSERSYGTFARQFTLPDTVDGDAAEAHLEDGVLTLRFPKKELPKAKRIAIGGGTSKSLPHAA